MAPRASVSALGKQGISHPSCERRTRRSEPKHAVHTQDQLLPLAAARGQSSCWDGAGRKASRLREPTFFFFKARECRKKKPTLRHLTQQFARSEQSQISQLQASDLLGAQGCKRERVYPGVTETSPTGRAGCCLRGGHGSHCACHGTAARRRSTLARSPRTTQPLQNHAMGRALAPAPDPSLHINPYASKGKISCSQHYNT